MKMQRSVSTSASLLALAAAVWLSYFGMHTSLRAEDGGIYIEFMARPTAPITERNPGHVFFCISLNLAAGTKEECFGFYPQNAAAALDGPGTVSNEFKRQNILNVSASLKHKIHENTRSAIYMEIRKWAGGDYKLLLNNCGDMVFAVARAAGLRTPDRGFLKIPTEFLQGLKDLYWAGNWNSGDPSTRFTLNISPAGKVDWTERNPETGRQLTKPVTLAMNADGTARVERANDAAVLQMQGFSTVIPQILAAGPKPSFMKLRREDARMSGEWNGIVVIKDPKGQFSQIRQPGTNPAKQFDFDRFPPQ